MGVDTDHEFYLHVRPIQWLSSMRLAKLHSKQAVNYWPERGLLGCWLAQFGLGFGWKAMQEIKVQQYDGVWLHF